MGRKVALDTVDIGICTGKLPWDPGILGFYSMIFSWVLQILPPPGLSRRNINEHTYRRESFSTLSDITLTSSIKILGNIRPETFEKLSF